MNNVPTDTLAFYLNRLRDRAGMSMEELAKEAGYKGRSSVQKFLSDPSVAVMQPRVAGRFAAALYGKGAPAITLGDLAPLVGVSLSGPSAISEQALAKLLQLQVSAPSKYPAEVEEAHAGRMPVVGTAHASFWMSSSPSLDTPEDWLTIPFSASEPLPGQYALRIKGPSIDKIAPEGSFAICQEFTNGVSAVPNGKFVHAERRRRGETEWTIKLAKWSPEGLLLCPHSNHKDHQTPLLFNDQPDIEEGTILGIVIGWYTPA